MKHLEKYVIGMKSDNPPPPNVYEIISQEFFFLLQQKMFINFSLAQLPTCSNSHLLKFPLAQLPTCSTSHLAQLPTCSTSHLAQLPTLLNFHLAQLPTCSTSHLAQLPLAQHPSVILITLSPRDDAKLNSETWPPPSPLAPLILCFFPSNLDISSMNLE